jgi:iron complex outermembrane recepter protein
MASLANLLRFAVAIMALCLTTPGWTQPKPAVEFDLPAQPLETSLRQIADGQKLQIVYVRADLAGIQARPLKAKVNAKEAIERLLKGTGLVASFTTDGVVVKKVNQSSSNAQEAPNENRTTRLEEIVVTGTRIRGARPSSALVTIPESEIRMSGHTNLGEVVRALPQNFSGGQNPGVLGGATTGGVANQNISGSSSFNLRGLGPDATLTLLDGMRLPYDGFTQATDVSVIPVAAIQRVEVLLDGASAIYGSDAVAGVANIILKRDFTGVEVSAQHGSATDGGYRHSQFMALGGTRWGSGGMLIAADASHNRSVRAGQRDYLGYLFPENTVFPRNSQKSVLLRAQQDLTDLSDIRIDAFYTDRTQESVAQSAATSFFTQRPNTNIWGVAPALSFALPADWSARVHGSIGRNDVELERRVFAISSGAQIAEVRTAWFNKVEATGVDAEGELFRLPGGRARLSIGSGYRKTAFENVNLATGIATTGGADHSYYGYGEVNLPLVSNEQNLPMISVLSLNGAVRHENYQSFGGTTTPKVGLTWRPGPGLDLRASWGKSFKVPTLQEQFSAPTLSLFPGSSFGAPAGTTVISETGGNPNLGPARAEVLTAGFVSTPALLPGLSIEANWFDIDYTDRVGVPFQNTAGTFTNPTYAGFFTVSPSAARQNQSFADLGFVPGSFTFNFTGAPYNPTTVIAIAHLRNINLVAQKVTGTDIVVKYATRLMQGNFSLSANASWMDGDRKLTRLTPALPAVGVIYFPPKFKGRLSGVWTGRSLTLASHINYYGSVKNTDVTPNQGGSHMTTLDVVLGYRWASQAAGDVDFQLVVTNATNEGPPFAQPALPFRVNFDSTNYSAVGRTISATVTKRF